MRAARAMSCAAAIASLWIGAVLLTTILAPSSIENNWRSDFDAIDTLLAELARPEDVSDAIWQRAVERLRAGFWNACFSEDRVSATQLRNLRQRVDGMILIRSPSFESLVAIWDTVGSSSDSAGKHIRKFREDFLDHLPAELIQGNRSRPGEK